MNIGYKVKIPKNYLGGLQGAYSPKTSKSPNFDFLTASNSLNYEKFCKKIMKDAFYND